MGKADEHVNNLLTIFEPLEKIRSTNGLMIVISGEGENGKKWERTVYIESSAFYDFLVGEYRKEFKTNAPRSEYIKEAISATRYAANAMETKAIDYRIAAKDGNIYYDLADGNLVKITKDGWDIQKNDSKEVFLVQSNKQALQATSIKNEGNIELLRKYVNVSDENWVLLVAYIVTCFNPAIEHPIFYINGAYGAGKSVLSTILKSLIDPSQADLLKDQLARFSSNLDSLAIQLNAYYYIAFDNLSSISKAQSDFLCMVVTGIAYEKRQLYTDSDIISLELKKAMCLNGIDSFIQRADLSDRCIFFLLEGMTGEKRKEKSVLWQEFTKDRPYILAGLFDLLAKALATVDNVKRPSYHRLADFHKFGYAVAEAMGGKGDVFEAALEENKKRRMELLYQSYVLVAILEEFMKQKGNIWEGTVSKLHTELEKYTIYDKFATNYDISKFPGNSSALSRKLGELKAQFPDYDYEFTFDADKDNCSYIKIRAKDMKKIKMKRIPIIRIADVGKLEPGAEYIPVSDEDLEKIAPEDFADLKKNVVVRKAIPRKPIPKKK